MIQSCNHNRFHPKTWLLLSLALLLLAGSAGCAGASSGESTAEIKMAPMSQMPADVQKAPVSVQEAYRFAYANPDTMKQIPCYCGCGDDGHTSNYDCYVSSVDGQGKVTYDPHALGCSICVDITQDAMRLLRQGKSVQEVRAYVDQTYAKYGPSNMP